MICPTGFSDHTHKAFKLKVAKWSIAACHMWQLTSRWQHRQVPSGERLIFQPIIHTTSPPDGTFKATSVTNSALNMHEKKKIVNLLRLQAWKSRRASPPRRNTLGLGTPSSHRSSGSRLSSSTVSGGGGGGGEPDSPSHSSSSSADPDEPEPGKGLLPPPPGRPGNRKPRPRRPRRPRPPRRPLAAGRPHKEVARRRRMTQQGVRRERNFFQSLEFCVATCPTTPCPDGTFRLTSVTNSCLKKKVAFSVVFHARNCLFHYMFESWICRAREFKKSRREILTHQGGTPHLSWIFLCLSLIFFFRYFRCCCPGGSGKCEAVGLVKKKWKKKRWKNSGPFSSCSLSLSLFLLISCIFVPCLTFRARRVASRVGSRILPTQKSPGKQNRPTSKESKVLKACFQLQQQTKSELSTRKTNEKAPSRHGWAIKSGHLSTLHVLWQTARCGNPPALLPRSGLTQHHGNKKSTGEIPSPDTKWKRESEVKRCQQGGVFFIIFVHKKRSMELYIHSP